MAVESDTVVFHMDLESIGRSSRESSPEPAGAGSHDDQQQQQLAAPRLDHCGEQQWPVALLQLTFCLVALGRASVAAWCCVVLVQTARSLHQSVNVTAVCWSFVVLTAVFVVAFAITTAVIMTSLVRVNCPCVQRMRSKPAICMTCREFGNQSDAEWGHAFPVVNPVILLLDSCHVIIMMIFAVILMGSTVSIHSLGAVCRTWWIEVLPILVGSNLGAFALDLSLLSLAALVPPRSTTSAVDRVLRHRRLCRQATDKMSLCC